MGNRNRNCNLGTYKVQNQHGLASITTVTIVQNLRVCDMRGIELGEQEDNMQGQGRRCMNGGGAN